MHSTSESRRQQRDQQIKQQITAAGGIERLVKAMEAHEGMAVLQQQGCKALGNLAHNIVDVKQEEERPRRLALVVV
jgi:hypothetical protein